MPTINYLLQIYMTHNVQFSASHAALWHVKYSLESFPSDEGWSFDYLPLGTSCIFCCAAAFEAIVNNVFLYKSILTPWDELKLKSKANVLFELKDKKIDWGANPFQNINQLIKVRNWLAHHKEPYLGLASTVDSDIHWISSGEGMPKAPRVDILKELKKASIKNYYNSVREAGVQIARTWGDEFEAESLKSEKYEPLIM